MTYLDSCYKTKPVLEYVESILLEDNLATYYDLSQSDKYYLTSLMMKAAGKEQPEGVDFECITQNNDLFTLIKQLENMLTLKSLDNQQKITETLMDNTVKYYEKSAVAIFDYVQYYGSPMSEEEAA